MQSNASFRLGTDLRQELLLNIKMGLELRLSFLGAQRRRHPDGGDGEHLRRHHP